jgi:hypothetical protein
MSAEFALSDRQRTALLNFHHPGDGSFDPQEEWGDL